MFMSEIVLETKLVGSISGSFYISSYQRGYRWGKDEVLRLLEDIYNNGDNKKYCLQPIVVRNTGSRYELIDGQQRLTTIYLIYKYMENISNGFIKGPQFRIEYETRENSEAFLQEIDMSKKNDNIDFWFFCETYETISNWFQEKEKVSTITNINKYFDETVSVIWYEVSENEDPIKLFTRLNIGKIPLTSAELVKAMFLSRDNNDLIDRKKQEEISLQWDNIEKELHREALWYFLTNVSKQQYQTRIDLILDLISKKPIDIKEKYYTFFYFDEKRKKNLLNDIWQEIQHAFLVLKDWFENHKLYHKIGYLIASDAKTLEEIFNIAKDKTKKKFIAELDNCIKKSIDISSSNYGELSYEKSGDYSKISRLLLLFNVESVHKNGENTQWFPFDKFKFQGDKKSKWSLEHIHAQQSEGLKTQEEWIKWLELHLPFVTALNRDNSELISAMEQAINKGKIDREDFEKLQEKVFDLLSEAGSVEYLHSISNLALLSTNDNAALSNSTFAVKRNDIIEKDKKGLYIPFCTKMVFFKYYTPSEENQLNFWGESDRKAYIEAINTVLEQYLSDKIIIETEA